MSDEDDGKREFQIENLFSLRVWYSAMFMGFIGGAIPFALLSMLWFPLGYISYVACPALILVIVYNLCHEAPVACPDCRKRIKMQATSCHHCSWSVSTQS